MFSRFIMLLISINQRMYIIQSCICILYFVTIKLSKKLNSSNNSKMYERKANSLKGRQLLPPSKHRFYFVPASSKDMRSFIPLDYAVNMHVASKILEIASSAGNSGMMSIDKHRPFYVPKHVFYSRWRKGFSIRLISLFPCTSFREITIR